MSIHAGADQRQMTPQQREQWEQQVAAEQASGTKGPAADGSMPPQQGQFWPSRMPHVSVDFRISFRFRYVCPSPAGCCPVVMRYGLGPVLGVQQSGGYTAEQQEAMAKEQQALCASPHLRSLSLCLHSDPLEVALAMQCNA